MENNFTVPSAAEIIESKFTKFKFNVEGFNENTEISVFLHLPRAYDMSLDKDNVDQVTNAITVTLATSEPVRTHIDFPDDNQANANYENVMKEAIEFKNKLNLMKPELSKAYVKARQDKLDARAKEKQSYKDAFNNDTNVNEETLFKAIKQLKVDDKLKYRLRGNNVYHYITRTSPRIYFSGFTDYVTGIKPFIAQLANNIAELG